MFRTYVLLPTVVSEFTTTSSTSLGLTIAGESLNSICVTRLDVTYTGAAQTVPQQVKMFDGASEIYRFGGTSGLSLIFYYPLKITRGTNFVATASVSVNTIAGNVSVQYYRDPR